MLELRKLGSHLLLSIHVVSSHMKNRILTTITCVTVDRALSPVISVRSSMPLVQNVNSVFGETLLNSS